MSGPDDSVELKVRPAKVPPLVTSLGFGLLVLAMTCGIAWFLYHHAQQAVIGEVRLGLQRSARLAADRLDGDVHDGLRENSLNTSPEFQTANKDLLRLVAADPDLAYAYTAIEQAGKIFLILDTEPPDGPEDTAAMAGYDDAPEDLKLAIREQREVVSAEPYTDQWGTFISAYTPFKNSKGQFSGVVGVDLGLTDYQRRLEPMQRARDIAYLTGVVLSILVGWGLWWMHRRDNAMQQLGRQLGNVNALLNVSKALGSNVGLDSLLPVIVGKTTTVMRAERSSLFLYDASHGVLIGRVTEGISAGAELVIPADRGIAGRVARTGQMANVVDPRQDPDFDDAFDKESGFRTRAVLTVPIRDNKGGILGVLQALNPRDHKPFDEDDEAMLHALAAQAQIALERERLNQSAQLRRKLEESLKFAQSIQLGMLPHRFPDPAESGIELFAKLIPAKMVGGDFFDFPWIDDHRLGLVMADVSGKGVPAALLMAKAMTMVRAYLGAEGDPAEALRRANEELSEDNDAAMFVTTFAAIFDCHTGELTYSNAGHNEPYLVREGKVIPLSDACLVPLGAQLGSQFVNARLQLQVSDVLYLYTDGVNEAMNPELVEYGDERLWQFLLQHAHDSAMDLANASIQSVQTHAGAAEQSDDIAVLVMRVRRIGEQAEHAGPADLHTLLDRTLQKAQTLLNGRAETIRHYGEIPAFEFSPGILGEVVFGLIARAVAAIARGNGNEAQNPRRPGQISLSTSHDSEFVHLAIQDNGRGFTPEMLPQIFDPLSSSSDQRASDGPGLPQLYQRVKTLGGRIRVSSRPEAGTRFIISLPRSRPQTA